jgi:hypothetical protein
MEKHTEVIKMPQTKIVERIPDLWCPFCGQKIYENGSKTNTNHLISDDIVEDLAKQKTVLVSCPNFESGSAMIEILAHYYLRS